MSIERIYQSKASFVLASSSSIRRQMLEEIGLKAGVHPPSVDEEQIKIACQELEPKDMALVISDEKGKELSDKMSDVYVISADQLGYLDGKLMNKTRDLSESFEQLKQLQGRQHQLITATSLFMNGECLWHTVQHVTLTMRALSDKQLKRYINADKPLYTVGGYYYEKHGKHLMSTVVGNEETILGFERQRLLNFLEFKQIIQ